MVSKDNFLVQAGKEEEEESWGSCHSYHCCRVIDVVVVVDFNKTMTTI
jgi:hypothetical protein